MSQSNILLQELLEKDKILDSYEAIQEELNKDLSNTSEPTNYDDWLECFSEVLAEFKDEFYNES